MKKGLLQLLLFKPVAGRKCQRSSDICLSQSSFFCTKSGTSTLFSLSCIKLETHHYSKSPVPSLEPQHYSKSPVSNWNLNTIRCLLYQTGASSLFGVSCTKLEPHHYSEFPISSLEPQHYFVAARPIDMCKMGSTTFHIVPYACWAQRLFASSHMH